MSKTASEKDTITAKICAALSIMSFQELAELGVNAQQAQKIKRGEKVRFYAKTYERLKSLVG